MNEQEFWFFVSIMLFLLAIGTLYLIIETLALKLFPNRFWKEDSISKELDLLYLELQKGKEINIAEYIKEKI